MKVIVKVGENGKSLVGESKIKFRTHLISLQQTVLTLERKEKLKLLYGKNLTNSEKEIALMLFEESFYSHGSTEKVDYELPEHSHEHPVVQMNDEIIKKELLVKKVKNIQPNENRENIYDRCFRSVMNLATSFEYRDKYLFTKLEEPNEENAAWFFLDRLMDSNVGSVILTTLIEVGLTSSTNQNYAKRLEDLKNRIESKFTQEQCQKLTIKCHIDKTWLDERYFPHNRDAAIMFRGPKKFWFTIGLGIDLFRKEPIKSGDSVIALLLTSPDSEDLRVKSELVGSIEWKRSVASDD